MQQLQKEKKDHDGSQIDDSNKEETRFNSMHLNMTSNVEKESENIYCLTSNLDAKTVSFNDENK